jgi:hypothetical protein
VTGPKGFVTCCKSSGEQEPGYRFRTSTRNWLLLVFTDFLRISDLYADIVNINMKLVFYSFLDVLVKTFSHVFIFIDLR